MNDSFSCPVYSESDARFLDTFGFWVEGVLLDVLAVAGIVGNSLASVIISRREMRNSFNLLLVSLAAFDSFYLVGSFIESFRKTFRVASSVHIMLFPYVLYPFTQIAITGSIFMTVAIAWERYIAVHYPLDYNQAMNDSHAMRKRLVKYVGPVSFMAVAFNWAKFFEGTALRKEVTADDGSPGYKWSVDVTTLRTHPIYSAYNNWSRLLILGICPFLLLVFFNTKIYNDIVERRRRRLSLRLQRQGESSLLTDLVSGPPATTGPYQNGHGGADSDHNGQDVGKEDNNHHSVGTPLSSGIIPQMSSSRPPPASLPPRLQQSRSGRHRSINSTAAALLNRSVHNVNERRRRFEDNLAAIFMGFALVFLLCHLPRLLLNIHELLTIKYALECTRRGQQGFSLWSLVLISVSHVLLVLNSSINILIYCLLSSKFREECAALVRRMSRRAASAAPTANNHTNTTATPE